MERTAYTQDSQHWNLVRTDKGMGMGMGVGAVMNTGHVLLPRGGGLTS